MSKRSNFKGAIKTAWLALPLASLMAVGAFAADHRPFPTSDPSQTRVRGQGQQTQSRTINSFPINCPSEKYKEVNLPLDQEKVSFQLSNACFCNPKSAENARAGLRVGMQHMATSMGDPKDPDHSSNQKIVADIRNGNFKSLAEYLKKYGLRLERKLEVTVPPGSSKKKSAFCYERGYAEGLFKRLVTGKP